MNRLGFVLILYCSLTDVWLFVCVLLHWQDPILIAINNLLISVAVLAAALLPTVQLVLRLIRAEASERASTVFIADIE